MKYSKLLILVGPTGVGKSAVAYQWALRHKAEIISADAYQVYRDLPIGTAQPAKEWQKKVPHHLVGVRKLKDNWNAVEFAKEAGKILIKTRKRGAQPLVTGGSGFYLKALIEGPPSGQAPSPEIRSKVQGMVHQLGNEKAHALLSQKDPAAAKRIHTNDTMRIGRALEKTFTTSPFPPQKRGQDDPKPLGINNVKILGLERSRKNLDELLLTRTQEMWRTGLLDEAKLLLEEGLSRNHPLWGAIGYQEAAAFIQGSMKREAALERIFRRTRQYAKRQWTWFKHQHQVDWIDLDDFSNINEAVDELQKRLATDEH